MKLPVDRGWAWVVTFACGGLFAWTAGSEKNRGIIIVELMEIYPEKSATSILWIFSMSMLTNRVAGPINGMLLAKTSTRFIAMLGVGIMAAGLVAFAYVPGVEYMYVVFGLFYGFGKGMVMLTAFTAFAPYFEKKQALSLGLTTAGSGIGMVATSLLLRKLFDNFSFSGAILLYAGLCLQTMILASLLRPFSYYSKWVKPTSDECTREEDNSSNKFQDSMEVQEKFRKRSQSVGDHILQLKTNHQVSTFLSTPDNIDKYSHSNRNISSLEILASSIQSIEGQCYLSEAELQTAGTEATKKSRFQWRLAYNPWCIILGIAAMAYCAGLGVVLPCIPPLGKQIGISKELVSILMSVTGAIEIPMRIFNGWFADRRLLSAPTQVGLCMLFLGTASLLCAILSNTAGIVIMVIGVSCAGTSVFSLMPVTCSRLFGKENVQSAMAINFVYQGLSLIVSTFSAGGIYEATGNWSYVYYYVSAMAAIGSTLMMIITFAARRKNQQQEDKLKEINAD